MLNRYRNLPLSIKINILIIGSVLIVIATILTLGFTTTNRLINEVGYERINQEVVVVERQLAQIQNNLETSAILLANTPGMVDAVASNNANTIRSLTVGAVPALNIDDFELINSDGERLIDAVLNTRNSGSMENELLAQSLLGVQRTTVLEETVDGVAQLSLVSIRPLRDENGTVVGGLLIAVGLGREFLNQISLEREGVEISLIYDGDVVEETLEEDPNSSNLNRDFVSRSLAGEVTINPDIVYVGNNVPHAEAYLPVQGLDDRAATATLVVRINNESIGAFRNNLIRSMAPIIISLIIGILTIAVLIVRGTVIRRIISLHDATAKLSTGDYTNRVEAVGTDEIGELGRAFNQMASDIQLRQSQLEDLNKSLEQRVDERTAQLKDARDDALAARRIAEENSRLKSEFLATMSHELRTPMNAIEGFTSIMLNRMGGVDFNDKTERFLNKVQSNSQRLLGLINDFLDLSRIESGRLELAHSPMHPEKMAAKWHENLASLADNKELDFIVEVDPDLPETIFGDEESITKIAVNLVGNAVKFTEVGSVSLNLKKHNDQMELQVIDTGIGIPPHALEFIFDEFRQVDQSSKRVHGGTGLGLAIVQRLTRAMGGTVSLQSEVGVGSTFTVLLPIHTESEVAEGVI